MNKYLVKKDILLMEFLLNFYSKKNVKNLLKYKQVKVNGRVVSQFNYQLNKGDQVMIDKSEINETDLKIIYEDKELIVINKPSGLLSISGGGEKEKTAYHMVSKYLKAKNKNAKIFVVHRLDKDTSGVLMFAKNEVIKNKLQNNWNTIVSKRGYLAIVEGKLRKKHGTIKNYLAESKTQMVYITNNKGKLAITNYKVLKESSDNSLVEVFLDTGRKNQIRVHMQSLGHSVVGDKKYGAVTNPIKRMGLHCHIFAFVHPDTKAKYEFEAPVPEEFKKIFK
ncbi:RluA family pseudouridine synthase [Thomasclavelia cocleata]|uniref:RluA family pseudouridine synthase n=1 Tax=Thomasclavelia cocleata TaxID=69824 RepID=UPI002432AD44|nr:RluA family pseudouridine synthase [Thomasclavelia cocleata]MCI9629761.1 RluA family pseudouridine synthase [Thomasclavelia cocleata]